MRVAQELIDCHFYAIFSRLDMFSVAADAVFMAMLFVCFMLASLFVSSCLGILLLLVTGVDTGTVVTVEMAILSVCSFLFDFVPLKTSFSGRCFSSRVAIRPSAISCL